MAYFITQLAPVMFSAGLPEDIVIAVQESSCVVFVIFDGNECFRSRFFAYANRVDFVDVRSVLNNVMCLSGKPYGRVQIGVAESNSTVFSEPAYVVYSDFKITDPDFLTTHFLTTRSSCRIHRLGSLQLSWWADALDDAQLDIVALVSSPVHEVPQRLSMSILSSSHDIPSVFSQKISVPELQRMVDERYPTQQLTLRAFSVRRGQRALTCFVTEETPSLTFSFLNAFLCEEMVEIYGVTKSNLKVSHNEAIVLNDSIFYDQETERTFEVETSALSLPETETLKQLFASRHILLGDRQVLITDSDAVATDDNTELNRFTFTFKFANSIPELTIPTHPRIFTEEYTSPFT